MAFLDETGLAELWSLIKAKDEALAAADVKTATGTYIGTDKYGSSNPNSLTFDFVPKIVFIRERHNHNAGYIMCFGLDETYRRYSFFSLYNGALSNTGSIEGYAKLVGTTIYWYSVGGASYQLNSTNGSGSIFDYFAIG